MSSWLTRSVCFTLVGVAFAVVPGLYPQNEPFFVPKQVILGAGALAVALASARKIRSPVHLSLLGTAGLAYFVSGGLSLALQHRRFENWVGWLALEGSAVVLATGTRLVAREEAGRRQVLSTIIAVACGVAAIAVLEAAGARLPWEAARRPQSTLGNRNFVGAFLAMALPFAIDRLVRTVTPVRFGAVTLLTLVILLTRCRSAWLGLLAAGSVALLLAAVAWRRGAVPFSTRKPAVVAGSLALAVALATLVPWPGLRWTEKMPLLTTFSRIAEYERGSGKGRLDQLRIGWAIGQSHPMLGVGPQQWDDADAEFSHVIPGAHVWPWTVNPTPSSDLVRIGSELGALGLTSAIVLVAAALYAGLAAVFAGRFAGAAVALLASCVVAVVHATLDAALYRPPTLAMIALLVGLLPPSPARFPVTLPVNAVRAALFFAGPALLCASLLRALPAVEIRVKGRSVEDLLAAQHWFSRHVISEAIIRRAVTRGQCEVAQAEAERAMALSPHRWGPLQMTWECARRRGDTRTQRLLAVRILAIEPHLASELTIRNAAPGQPDGSGTPPGG